MNDFIEGIPTIIERAGWLAPLIFILLHLIRPFLFLPVIVVCIAGGYFFGFFYGSLYSLVGLTLMSFFFYKVVDYFPSIRTRFSKMKQRIFKNRQLTLGQVMILRMLPFVHFHLLSLYLMEMTSSFKEYMKYSFGGLILPAMLFTAFGQAISEMSLTGSLITIGGLAVIFYLMGQKGPITYKWDKFFASRSRSRMSE
ncbi:TVP38/TMEM64 family protein [Alteribacter keqinensis]|uniref:TVP38/TMEM64 family membrane protein n=1 Tax=Alteribacter keqinensis TaxID=2483800 RepID=A0A3M7U0T9_9BACI|nr:VTT domain-containing protein [Alteribacter keqinensis]RNA70295.1 TVP38/TMEM64 family protein [Alteribacter keqinensis]